MGDRGTKALTKNWLLQLSALKRKEKLPHSRPPLPNRTNPTRSFRLNLLRYDFILFFRYVQKKQKVEPLWVNADFSVQNSAAFLAVVSITQKFIIYQVILATKERFCNYFGMFPTFIACCVCYRRVDLVELHNVNGILRSNGK